MIFWVNVVEQDNKHYLNYFHFRREFPHLEWIWFILIEFNFPLLFLIPFRTNATIVIFIVLKNFWLCLGNFVLPIYGRWIWAPQYPEIRLLVWIGWYETSEREMSCFRRIWLERSEMIAKASIEVNKGSWICNLLNMFRFWGTKKEVYTGTCGWRISWMFWSHWTEPWI